MQIADMLRSRVGYTIMLIDGFGLKLEIDLSMVMTHFQEIVLAVFLSAGAPTAQWVVENNEWRPSWPQFHKKEESISFEHSTLLAAHANDMEIAKLLVDNRRTKDCKYPRIQFFVLSAKSMTRINSHIQAQLLHIYKDNIFQLFPVMFAVAKNTSIMLTATCSVPR